ncbi:MAG: hypothetical protein AAGC77_06720 [Pseudomonadota bacterium]
MLPRLQIWFVYVLKRLVVFTPVLAAMYFLYSLGKNEVWDTETPHRDLITGAIVATGMLGSFLLQFYFAGRTKK